MTALYLSQPAICTALGDGIAAHIAPLLAGAPSPLHYTEQVVDIYQVAKTAGIQGIIKGELRPFPADLPVIHQSRNNQLLWHCLAQIEPQIQRAIDRFGAQRIAVIIGSSTTGVDENLPVFKYAAEHQDWSGAPFKQQQQFFSAPADFVTQVYGLQGLSYGISTACTSGAKALISAARLLKAGLCDAVICGGVDELSPLTIQGFGSLSVLSDQRSNPLSANRSGINLGEGAAVFVMTKEKLDENGIALLGYGASSDAYHMSSPHPEGEGAISAFQNALASAQVSVDQVGWINLHGTGTIHNDKMEALAVHQVFGDQVPCTSTKPYTGHTLGAAGAVEAAILWGVIARQFNPNGQLPPQCWDGVRDETLPAIAITHADSHWAQGVRIGASSSFAFGGNNSVLILGECND